jgi:hypothetical protein
MASTIINPDGENIVRTASVVDTPNPDSVCSKAAEEQIQVQTSTNEAV